MLDSRINICQIVHMSSQSYKPAPRESRPYKEFFRALGNPARFRIVQLLRRGPHHVGQIAEQLGFEQSRVSHNLACLLHCGFVLWNWAGKNKIYRLNPELAPVLAGIEKHLAHYATALDSCRILESESAPVVVLAKTEVPPRNVRRMARRMGRSRR